MTVVRMMNELEMRKGAYETTTKSTVKAKWKNRGYRMLDEQLMELKKPGCISSGSMPQSLLPSNVELEGQC